MSYSFEYKREKFQKFVLARVQLGKPPCRKDENVIQFVKRIIVRELGRFERIKNMNDEEFDKVFKACVEEIKAAGTGA